MLGGLFSLLINDDLPAYYCLDVMNDGTFSSFTAVVLNGLSFITANVNGLLLFSLDDDYLEVVNGSILVSVVVCAVWLWLWM